MLSIPTKLNLNAPISFPAVKISSFLPQPDNTFQSMILSNRSRNFQRFFTKTTEQKAQTSHFFDSNKIKEYEILCEKGDLKAISEYAPSLLTGSNGVESNPTKAAQYFKHGSDLHDTDSMYNYALCLYRGQGVKTDYSAAATLFKETAMKGKLDSYLYLYKIYSEGLGVIKDRTAAIEYLKAGADKGQLEACTEYALTLKEGDQERSEYLKKAAEKGEIKGQFHYGVSLVKSDKGKAFYYLVKAAEGGLPYAQNYVGDIFLEGEIGPKDYGMAAHYYELAANQNDADGCYNLSHIYMSDKSKKEEVVKNMKKAADLGKVDAMLEYGQLVYLGKGSFKKDRKEAEKYIKMAADSGSDEAMLMYGMMSEGSSKNSEADKYYKLACERSKTPRAYKTYMKFLNKQRKFNEADKYMLLAAEAGDDECLYGAALYHFVRRNTKECEKCLKKAVEKENSDAMHFYGSILVSKNSEESLKLLKKAIDKGNVHAMYTYANYIYEGKFKNVDKKEAFKYMKMAADNNVKEAVMKCAKMLSEGKYCTKNMGEALKYYKIAADRYNNPEAQFTFGSACLVGYDGFKVDKKLGASYVKRAADQKLPDAVYKLGCIYKEGEGVEKDGKKAMEYFKKAADMGYVPHK